jgi:alkylation response protein AidB-like acyl-CoA dehydrogenase
VHTAAIALHHAGQRQVMGKSLSDQPLMRAVLAQQALQLPHAIALLTHQPAEGILKLHFGTGIGAVAQFVFQERCITPVSAR